MRNGGHFQGATRKSYRINSATLIALNATEIGYVGPYTGGWQAKAQPTETQGMTWTRGLHTPQGFIAIGDKAHYLVSTYGINWEAIAAPNGALPYVALAYSPTLNRFVIWTSTGHCWYSSNIRGPWTKTQINALPIKVSDCKWVGDKFIVVGTAGTNRMYSSTDGITWTLHNPTYISGQACATISACLTGDLIVGKASSFAYNTARDMVTWGNTTGFNTPVEAIAFDDINDGHVLIASGGSTSSIRRIRTTSRTVSNHSPAEAVRQKFTIQRAQRVIYAPYISGTRHGFFYFDGNGNFQTNGWEDRFVCAAAKLMIAAN